VACRYTCLEGTFAASSYPACYASVTSVTFFEAYDACAKLALGGARARMATPRTTEDLMLLGTFQSATGWIGAADFDAEGAFRWLDLPGEFPYAGQQAPWVGSNPDDAMDREDCVALVGGAMLDDSPCEVPRAALCEFVPGWALDEECDDGEVDPGEECQPGDPDHHGLECSSCNLGCPAGDGWSESPVDHVCYKLVNPGTTRSGALLECALVGRLATPDDIADVAVARYVCDEAMTDDCWLDASRPTTNDAFAWTSEESFDYVDMLPPWRSDEPDGAGTIVILDAGALNAVDDQGARGALCEIGDLDQ